MNAPQTTDLFGLLQIAIMLYAPVMLGSSIARCLHRAPSRFSVQSLTYYFRRQPALDAVWLGATAFWLLSIGLPSIDTSEALSVANLHAAVCLLWLGTAATQLRNHRVILPELDRIEPPVDLGGESDVVTIDSEDLYQAPSREIDPDMNIPGAGLGVMLFGTLALVSLFLIALISIRLDSTNDFSILMSHIVLTGLWLSLRVIIVDLALDVWPGMNSPSRLRGAFLYYTQIFQQWPNWIVLVALMTAMLGAPLAYLVGYVPLAAMSFTIWMACCLTFATCWNKVAYPAGKVPTTLPLPMAANRYSAKHPVWAYFFSCIHFVMALCLFAGIWAINAW